MITETLFPLAALAVSSAVGLAVWGFRDPKADEPANQHDVSDYHEMEARAWHRGFDTARRYPRPKAIADDILPPAPPGMNAGSPLYAGMLFDTWHPETPEATAARFLRELGEQARAKTAARDLTGAFPVVAVA